MIKSTWPVYTGSALALGMGLFFVFVWAPHPWGWEGFDHYHDLALELARGRGFPTMEVPWGYAYFLALFYRLFGDRPAIPLTIQVVLNASIPIVAFAIARSWADRATAALAALLVGVFSFNTVYASTQSSDAVCTWLFTVAVWAFVRACAHSDIVWFAATGALVGIAPQFRPNLIIVPALLAAYAAFDRPTKRGLAGAAVLVLSASAMLAPWVIRNYRLTGEIIPTSVHAGVQLWYGTLQTGPYLRSRAHNPRSVFEASVFDYGSLEDRSIVVDAQVRCDEERPSSVRLSYWTDNDSTERQVAPTRVADPRFTFELPATRAPAVVYYYFVTTWPPRLSGMIPTTPPAGKRDPFVYFVSGDHLGDLDRHGDLLDFFDVIRFARHAAWNEPVPFPDRLTRAGIFDVQTAIASLMRPLLGKSADGVITSFESDATQARIVMADGSAVIVPRSWHGLVTDLTISGNLAASVMVTRESLRALDPANAGPPIPGAAACSQAREIGVNQEFYRREPHLMRRYWTLALDNIRRDPAAFVRASVFRAARLFVIQGTADRDTAQQFRHSNVVYAAAALASFGYLGLFLMGAVVALRHGMPVGLPLLLIASLPATLAPVLTNMRYVVTVQPLMLIFVAIGMVATVRRARLGRSLESPSASASPTGRGWRIKRSWRQGTEK